MISGVINAKIEAVIALEILIAQEQPQILEAILDTGYSGSLTLPRETAAAFGLSSVGDEQLTLADGTEILAAICPAWIMWDGLPRRIDVDVLETAPLVGMTLLKGYDLQARIVEGGPVTLTACK